METPSTRHTVVNAGLLLVPAVAAAALTWRRLLTWGATDHEVSAPMPGDEIVGQARYLSTHAITIDAPPDQVWPWLVQIGQGRGGLYSYDWLENLLGLDIHSATTIDPSLQTLGIGDVVRLVPDGMQPPLRFLVDQLQQPRLLVLGPDCTRPQAFTAGLPYPSWTSQITPHGAGSSRLVVRFQADFVPTILALVAYKHALRPIHFFMERKMMLGLKQRAEDSSFAGAANQPVSV